MRRLRISGPIAAVALVYLATLAILPAGGLWIVDNGSKRVQVQALLASGFRDFSLPLPGRELDPAFEFNPMPKLFSEVREGRLYSQYPPAFAVLSALPFSMFGDAGLCLLPLLASLALLGFLGWIADLAEVSPRVRALSILVAGLATPLWFYAVVFWEHAVAAGLCLGSVALAFEFLIRGSRRLLWLSGLAIALASGLREPLLLLAAALGILVLSTTPRARLQAGLVFGGGIAAGLFPSLILQWFALGEPLGIHVSGNFAANAADGSALGHHLRTRLAAFYNLFLAAGGSRTLSAALNLPFAVLLIAQPRPSARAYRACALGVAVWALVGLVVSAFGYATAHSPIDRMLAGNGFFAAAPLLAVGLVRRRERDATTPGDRVIGWLLRLALAYALLYLAFAPLISTAGIHWGNRFLLDLYPLLALPCAAGLLELWRGSAARGLAVLLLLLVAGSVVLQVFSIDLLRRKLVFGERFEQAVREAPEAVVVTDVWWVPLTLARELLRKPIFYVSTDEQADDLLGRLARHGSREFLFVTADAGRSPNPRARVIEDEGLGFFSLRLEHHALPGR